MIQVLLVLAITISISDSIKSNKIGILSILFRQNEPKIFEIINKNENIKSAQYILFCKVGINLLLKSIPLKNNYNCRKISYSICHTINFPRY